VYSASQLKKDVDQCNGLLEQATTDLNDQRTGREQCTKERDQLNHENLYHKEALNKCKTDLGAQQQKVCVCVCVHVCGCPRVCVCGRVSIWEGQPWTSAGWSRGQAEGCVRMCFIFWGGRGCVVCLLG